MFGTRARGTQGFFCCPAHNTFSPSCPDGREEAWEPSKPCTALLCASAFTAAGTVPHSLLAQVIK